MGIYYTEKQWVGLKKETTPGTYAPVAAADVIPINDLNIKSDDVESVESKRAGGFNMRSPSTVTKSYSGFSGSVEAYPGSALGTAPDFGTILNMGGMSETITANTSVVYEALTDLSTQSKYSALAYLAGARVLQGVGITNNTMSFEALAGDTPKVVFDASGRDVTGNSQSYVEAGTVNENTNLLGINYDSTKMHILLKSATYDATVASLACKGFRVIFGITANKQDNPGRSENIITSHDITIETSVEMETNAGGLDWKTLRRNKTPLQWHAIIGDTAGGRIKLDAGNVFVESHPASDDNGIQYDDIVLRVVRDQSDSNKLFTITLD